MQMKNGILWEFGCGLPFEGEECTCELFTSRQSHIDSFHFIAQKPKIGKTFGFNVV